MELFFKKRKSIEKNSLSSRCLQQFINQLVDSKISLVFILFVITFNTLILLLQTHEEFSVKGGKKLNFVFGKINLFLKIYTCFIWKLMTMIKFTSIAGEMI